MVIEENKVIELEDKSRHLLLKKIRHETVPYLICLRLGDKPVFELFRFRDDDSVDFVGDVNIVSKVLHSYVTSDTYKADLEKMDEALENYLKTDDNVDADGDATDDE